jgi:hypothetical protein
MRCNYPVAAALVAIAALACGNGVALADDSGSKDLDPVSMFSGSDFSPHSQYYYLGTIVPVYRDSSTTQIVLRGYGSYNHYDYKNPGKIDADEWQGDVMLGYQADFSRFTTAVYVGADFQDHRLFPNDPDNQSRGSEAGFKVAAEIESGEDSPFYFDLDGEYSTAFSSYWARTRIGYNAKFVTFGPEASVDGSVGYDSQRLGGFATFDLSRFIKDSQLTLSAGHQFVHDADSGVRSGGGEGTYGAISIGWSY